MKESYFPPRVCPSCGRTYSAPSALSRKDNAMQICPDCGIREALESLGCDREAQEHILGVIHSATPRS